MTTTNDTPAQRLRVALKSAGFNARQVSVRYPHSTLHVTIRDASVSLTKVSAIAGAFESVSRDHKSGEILCGGYVTRDIISRGLLKSSELTIAGSRAVRRASTSANRD